MHAELRLTPAHAAQPRAIGAVRLVARQGRGSSQIAGLRQSGSLKLLFPRPVGPALEAVILNTAVGLTGGDRMLGDGGGFVCGAGCGWVLARVAQALAAHRRAQPDPRRRFVCTDACR